jgi:hypothetical protein
VHLKLARFRGTADELCAGEYTVATPTGRPIVCCPLCAERFEIPKGINYAGGLSSCAVKCPRLNCNWWDLVALLEFEDP